MILKTLILAGLLVAAPPVEVKYNVTMDGSPLGNAVMTTTELEQGSRQVVLTMNLEQGKRSSRVRQETIYNADGSAKKKVQELLTDKSARTLISVEIDGRVANVTATEEGKTTTKKVTLADIAPVENPSYNWFIKTTPKPGDKAAYYTFDIGERAWRLEEIVYTGKEKIELATGAKELNVLKGNKGITLMDNKGTIVAIQMGQIRIEQTK